ncbi:hypothetical protein LXL04_037509 [Taraxacum kok-saghyz]
MDEFFRKLKRPFNASWDAVESDMAVFERILFRLPVKSILIFKSVSKIWKSIISTMHFMLLHYFWSKKNAKFFAFHNPNDLENNKFCEMHLVESNGAYSESYTIPVFKTLEDIHLVASFNGLICFINDVTRYEKTYNVDIHICNPATHEVLVLPPSHSSFDVPTFGVLYSNKTHIYKIFKFFSDPDDPETGYCEVYSSKTEKWKLFVDVPSRTLMGPTRSWISNASHICIHEKVYWFISDEHDDEIYFPTSILMVDMEDNFREIKLPTCPDIAFLVEFWGRLCFVEWEGVNFNLWLYVEENGGWNLFNTVRFPVKWLDVARFDSVVAQKDEILFVYRDVVGLRHELLYNVCLATWKDFHIVDDAKDKEIIVFPFFETLLPCPLRSFQMLAPKHDHKHVALESGLDGFLRFHVYFDRKMHVLLVVVWRQTGRNDDGFLELYVNSL